MQAILPLYKEDDDEEAGWSLGGGQQLLEVTLHPLCVMGLAH